MHVCGVHFRFKVDVEVSLRRPYHIDLKTGMYRGRSVLVVKTLAFYLFSSSKLLLIHE